MKIELKGWTVEDYDGGVEVYLPGGSNFVIGGGRVDSGTLARDVFNTLEDKFAKATGVTALTVAAELERLLDGEKVGEITVSRGETRRTEVNPCPEGFTFDPASSVAEDLREVLKPKDIVVHGYTVHADATVSGPDGYCRWPVASWRTWKGQTAGSSKVIKYIMDSRDSLATQADMVAKIKEYFEGPRDVKGHRLHRCKCGYQWFVRDSVSASLIGYGQTDWLGGLSAPPAFKAAQEKFKDGEPSLPEVVEFIENYREPVWHHYDLTSERDDKDNVVIPLAGRQYIRLSLLTGKSSVHKTAEEAKRCE